MSTRGTGRLLTLAEAGRSASWAALCDSDDLFCTAPWLAVERDAVGPWVPARSACLVRTDGDHVVAGVTLQQFDRAVGDETCRVDKMVRSLTGCDDTLGAELEAALLPSLMCGGWFNSTVLTPPGLPGPAAGAARRAAIAEAVATARSWGSPSVCFPYVDGADAGLRAALRDAGFRELPAPARHVLDCDHPSYDAYLATLPSRRRVRMRKEWRQFQEAGVVTDQVPLEGATVERAAALAHRLDQKYGESSTAGQLTEWFAAIARHVPATVFTASLEGRVFAMTLWLHCGERLYGFHAGFDYEVGRGLPMYSVVGYHLPIAYGCAHPGVKVLEYGISADEAKLLRGTRALPQTLALLPLTPRAEAVLTKLEDRLPSPA
ncbi:hypothetical protein GCM10010218_37370 [Streptomyces mashuensis]|uniref:BioF2-like acetyltransferase domain-containing protein n=1 Tax=Streptomyces mashuensis TaxID=33904 RepID=A0A919B657_9ACTN|nr:GNAT family N-acetyltransferase [Streptomyces mashuensis]GHF52434.1 hypothetical protein GCM10010218_37370 [Streptomyces mashuensis]